MYYAISLNPTHLSGDRLLNIFLLGLMELPGLASSYYLPKWIGRARSTAIFFISCGVLCVVAPFLRKGKKTYLKETFSNEYCKLDLNFFRKPNSSNSSGSDV